MDKKFSHLDNKGNARIVDISKKKKRDKSQLYLQLQGIEDCLIRVVMGHQRLL